MRSEYQRRRDALVRALAERLPHVPVIGADAGLHVLIELEEGLAEDAVLAQTRDRKIALESLRAYALPGYVGLARLLVGYARLPEASIPAAVDELAIVLERASAAPGGPARSHQPQESQSADLLGADSSCGDADCCS
jgi:GntR family transcriptional regulator / MocR family aminotransferase